VKKISLEYLHSQIPSVNYSDKEYFSDFWYQGLISINKLLIAHTDLHQWVDLSEFKNDRFVDSWDSIKPEVIDKIVPRAKIDNIPPIIVVKDIKDGFYRVWDGQLRVFSFVEYGFLSINAFIYDEGL
jgi:hypothetical protein